MSSREEVEGPQDHVDELEGYEAYYLPQEIWLIVFIFLSRFPGQLLKCKQVCKLWSGLCWMGFSSITALGVRKQTFEDIIKMNYIESLALRDVKKVEEEEDKLIKNNLSRLTVLKRLKELCIRSKGNLPKNILLFTNLTSLQIELFKLESSRGVVTELSLLTNLTHLSLQENKGQENIHSTLFSLTNLRSFNCEHNDIGGQSRGWSKLHQLEQLELCYNSLDRIPAEVCALTNLRRLQVSNNVISSVNPLQYLVNIQELQLSNDQIVEIPSSIKQLVQLTSLDMCHNQLRSIPKEVQHLTSLTRIDLHNNRLASIPGEIQRLVNLKDLYLYNNKIASIPPEVKYLTCLNRLYLSDNTLVCIPSEIGFLYNLVELELHNNAIVRIPMEVHQLHHLMILDLYLNKIEQIPSEMQFMYNLRVFRIFSNRLTDIPLEVFNIPYLSLLNVSNNKITQSLSEIQERLKGRNLILIFGNQRIEQPTPDT